MFATRTSSTQARVEAAPGFGPVGTGKIEDTIAAYATVRLELESRPECITLVRSALAGLGEYLGLDAELLDDLKTAISEACNNVVLHAYRGGTGPLAVCFSVDEEAVEVVVGDRGTGIERVSAAEDRMGVGLAVISALATTAEFRSEPGEGTEVRMSFGTAGLVAPAVTIDGPGPAAAAVPGDIAAGVAPVELLPPVMGRLVRAAAAGAHFSLDRFPALHELTTAVSAAAGAGEQTREIGFSITSAGLRQLALRAGPLPPGTGEAIAGNGASAAMHSLVESIESELVSGGELITVTVAEAR